MTTRDKLGLAILIGVFVLLGLALAWTYDGFSGPGHSPSESPIVKQRLINLQKGK